MELGNDDWCFACGKYNPHGLQLDIKIEGKKSYFEFTPKKQHQGYQDFLHGGIMSTLLDEAVGNLVWRLGLGAVTAKIEVNLRKPVKIGEKLFVTGEVIKEQGRKVFAKSEARTEDGVVVADCEALLIKLKK